MKTPVVMDHNPGCRERIFGEHCSCGLKWRIEIEQLKAELADVRAAHEPAPALPNPMYDSVQEYCMLHCAWKGGGPCLADDCPRRASEPSATAALTEAGRAVFGGGWIDHGAECNGDPCSCGLESWVRRYQKLLGINVSHWPPAVEPADTQFKNFHRLLCERFGYMHDEKDWKRDQVSLIEWIVTHRAAEPAAVPDENGITDEDAANIGRSLMKTIARNRPDYCWLESPAEIVVDLLNEIYDLKAPSVETGEQR